MDGHEVLPNQVADSNGVAYMVIGVDADTNNALLDIYANECARDANLLLIVPKSMLPFTLPRDVIMHKWMEPTSLLELALWGSKPMDSPPLTREECRTACGADVIVPAVLPFLTGTEIGRKTDAVAVGERELFVKDIEAKLRGQLPKDAEDGNVLVHQMVHNSFNKHPSGKSSTERGMLIRHLNGITSDARAVNLTECSIYEGLVHIDDWTTDWVCFLNDEEQEFVRENLDTFKDLFRASA